MRALAAYEPRSVDIDGCVYREGLSAVRISGGVAGNVVPDACTVTINFRFAPDRSEARGAGPRRRRCLRRTPLTLTDSAAGALPGLQRPRRARLRRRPPAPVRPRAKYGWTDVARFAALGIPAVNYGPGDPNLAHTSDESIDVTRIGAVAEVLKRYLTADQLERQTVSSDVEPTYLVDRYSSMPSKPPSRPKPLCLTPPKGADGLEIRPLLSPTMPVCSPSTTRRPARSPG